MMPARIHLVTHPRAHFEELAAVWFLLSIHFRQSAEELFPGVQDAELLFWDKLPRGRTREQLERRGYVFIGCFGGEFDEHSSSTSARKEGESAASLTARRLRIDQDPTIEPLLKFITSRDLSLGQGPFEFPALVKRMNDTRKSPEKIWEWSAQIFETIYSYGPEFFGSINPNAGMLWEKFVHNWARERKISDIQMEPSLARLSRFTQKRLDHPCGTEFEPHVLVEAMRRVGFPYEDITKWAFIALDVIHEQGLDFLAAEKDFAKAKKYLLTINGREIRAVVGHSDSLQFSKYARYCSKGDAGVVVVKNSRGNVMIETNSHLGLDLMDTAERLRIEELRIKRKPIPSDRRILREENGIEGCEEWYCPITDGKGQRILNGSTTKDRCPTRLSLESITGILFFNLHVEGFGVPALCKKDRRSHANFFLTSASA